MILVLENQRSVHNTKQKLQTGKMNDTLLLLSFKNATLSNWKTLCCKGFWKFVWYHMNVHYNVVYYIISIFLEDQKSNDNCKLTT
jgi:hypothetical protein